MSKPGMMTRIMVRGYGKRTKKRRRLIAKGKMDVDENAGIVCFHSQRPPSRHRRCGFKHESVYIDESLGAILELPKGHDDIQRT
jgi:hypothetical protein